MISACTLCAQPASSPSPKFEVASIKPADPNVNGFRIQTAPGGRFMASGVTAKFLIQQAYGVRDFQVVGGPGWMDTARFEISAKAEDGTENDRDGNSLRLRALLADRFQLRFTRETREMPIYHLVVAKSGPKMTVSATGAEARSMSMGRGRLNVKGAGTAMLAVQLSQTLGRTVLDQTGLAANFYDFKLEWSPEGQPLGPKDGDAPPPNESTGPTLFTALQEQLGLKLESAKGPVEVLVIERIEKPTEN